MNKVLVFAGLAGAAVIGYMFFTANTGDSAGAGGSGGGSKKENPVTQTYSETVTSPYEQSQPIFNIAAPTPIINLLPDFTNYNTGSGSTKKEQSSNSGPTYETAGAPYKPAEPKKQVSYIQYNDSGFQKPLKDTIFGGI